MALPLDLVEGWTERIIVELSADGAVVDLTGMTVQLQIYSRFKVALSMSGSAGIVSAAAGTVYFDPAASDLLASHSPHIVRWKVTDVSGKVAFFPKNGPDQWNVRIP